MNAIRGDLSGKVAIVTGGTSGIGEAIALRVAEWGAAGVVINGRDETRGAESVAAVRKVGAEALFVAGELDDTEAPARIVAAGRERFGRIDCLVNAAAITDRGGLLDTPADAAFFDRLFAANVRAPFLLMQAAAGLMRDAGRGGSIVNILSMNAHCGTPELGVYSASKGALATLTRNAAHSFRTLRIRVNGINLGWTDTPAEHTVQEKTSPHGKDWLHEAEKHLPFGRLIQPDEVANLAAFLLSEQSGVMTGALIDMEQYVVGANPLG